MNIRSDDSIHSKINEKNKYESSKPANLLDSIINTAD